LETFGLYRRFICSFVGLIRAVPLSPPNLLEALLLVRVFLSVFCLVAFWSDEARLYQILTSFKVTV
jgi:hypothetical protein